MKRTPITAQEAELIEAFRQNPFEEREMILKLTQRSANRHQEEMELTLQHIADGEKSGGESGQS